jgi:hypothetical protein
MDFGAFQDSSFDTSFAASTSQHNAFYSMQTPVTQWPSNGTNASLPTPQRIFMTFYFILLTKSSDK